MRLALVGIFSVLTFPVLVHAQFYRVMYGPVPSPGVQAKLEALYGAKLIYIDALKNPVHVPGTVWHNDAEEARLVQGDLNPVVPNAAEKAAYDLVDDKWLEYGIFKNTGIAIPRTELLSETIGELKLRAPQMSREDFFSALKKGLSLRFPKGFLIKPRHGFASMGVLPDEAMPFYRRWRGYRHRVRPIQRSLEKPGDLTADEIHLELKSMVGYIGRYLDELLTTPENFIVQEKVADFDENGLMIEFRVHVAEGKVLEHGATDRWMTWDEITSQDLRDVRALIEQTLARLPEPYKHLSYGIDLLRGRDGKYYFIESNVGGNSGFLDPEVDVLSAQSLAKEYGGEAPILTEILEAAGEFHSATEVIANFRDILNQPEIRYLLKLEDTALFSVYRLMFDLLGERWNLASPSERRDITEFLKENDGGVALQEMRSGAGPAKKRIGVKSCEALLGLDGLQ